MEHFQRVGHDVLDNSLFGFCDPKQDHVSHKEQSKVELKLIHLVCLSLSKISGCTVDRTGTAPAMFVTESVTLCQTIRIDFF